MKDELRHYQYEDCQLTAHGVILTYDNHDQSLTQAMILVEEHRQRLPCWAAERLWYQDGAEPGTWNNPELAPIARVLENDGVVAIANYRELGVVDDKVLAIIAPFRGTIELLGNLTTKQLRCVVKHSSWEVKTAITRVDTPDSFTLFIHDAPGKSSNY
jgi:hypothetical protein